MKTLVQCDFDGTITREDVSFLLLDLFAQGDWRCLLQEYKQHSISLGDFNTRAFAMIRADKSSLLQVIREKVEVRDGFHKLVDYCLERDFRFVIVSNGLEFYIRAILEYLGSEGIEVHAAQAQFRPQGMEVRYVDPNGCQLEEGFKEAYIKSFLNSGYRVMYVGNGDSDIIPASYAHQVFATGDLLDYCRNSSLKCKSFDSLTDIVAMMESL